jgi:hypothetical protein
MRFRTNIGDGFAVTIEYAVDSDDDISEIAVYSATTGESLEPLLYGSSLWDEAYSEAQRHLGPRYPTARNIRATCYDTPYA